MQISNERPTTLPLVYFAPETGDPDPPGSKHPTGNQPDSPDDQAGINSPTETDDADSEPPDPDEADPPIMIYGGG